MESQNPWWYGEEDVKYEEWKSLPIKWIPPILSEFNFKAFSLNFLVGPRQVGKTTALRILIHKFLLPKVAPKSVFYYSCEELTDFRELGEILDNYISFKKANRIKKSFIILDEITFVKEWYRALKIRIDKGLFKNDVIIVSGSASVQLLKEKEYFPGRRGYGKDIIFYPLDFPSYFRIFKKNVELVSSNILEVEESIKANRVFSSTLKEMFEKYLITGGFPLPIIEFYTKGKVTFDTRKIYIDWFKNDFSKLGKNESYMKEVISYLILSRLSPVSWNSIARETSIGSPHTAQDYVESLKNLFVVEILNFIDHTGRILYRKNKKIHFTDPFLYTTLCEYTRNQPFEDNILESVVASHLSRKFETFYWKNKTEVDVVVKLGKKLIGIEVKTSLRPWRKPLHLDKVYVIKKDEIPLFLSSLEVFH
ncbi:MAG: ATP-binding protein [Candidatus Aenigmarchaeota archaeon]|nr:ATP-binding protein [Candidatus Aenigmarchaeota archaeon]